MPATAPAPLTSGARGRPSKAGEGVAMTEENWQGLADHRPEDPEGMAG
jgi:hypothetical protein